MRIWLSDVVGVLVSFILIPGENHEWDSRSTDTRVKSAGLPVSSDPVFVDYWTVYGINRKAETGQPR